MLAKLHFYGIRGVSEDWCRSYLTNRRQKVAVKSPICLKFLWVHGVPQGSMLGPLLFTIKALPMRLSSVSQTIVFADYTNVVISNMNFEDFSSVSNLVLSHVIKWFAANNLFINLEKNEYNEIHKKEFIAFYVSYWL